MLSSKGGTAVSGLVDAGHNLRGCSTFTGIDALWVCVSGLDDKGESFELSLKGGVIAVAIIEWLVSFEPSHRCTRLSG